MLPELPYLFWKHRVYPASVVHIGAHHGQERAFYSNYCPGPVLWIEALPTIHKVLAENIAQYPNQRALCALLSDRDGQDAKFGVASNNGQSSSMLDFGVHTQQHPEVRFTKKITLRTVTAKTLFAQNKIVIPPHSYLCLDVQGAELKVLKGLGDYIDQFDFIYCEVNRDETYRGCPLVEEIDAFLKGFNRAETWWYSESHSWGDAIYSRLPEWEPTDLTEAKPITLLKSAPSVKPAVKKGAL